jgi:transcriptional regulator with XRE-family HTH domain
MTTPLQAARRARGWSQVRMVSELMRLVRWKEIRVASAASLKTQLSRWENGHVTPDYYRALLCELFKVTPGELGFGTQQLPSGRVRERSPTATLIAKREWTRDDISNLSAPFDDAISGSVLADIEMLAHEWLASDKPQLVELNAGRRIGDSLVATTEHRTMQLRRADDFVSGRTSHTMVHQELQATTKLLDEASLTEDDNALIRENSLYLSWLAEDYILLNEIEIATEIATHVLELGSRANSARTDERLRHSLTLLRRLKGVQVAVNFIDRYKNYSTIYSNVSRATKS